MKFQVFIILQFLGRLGVISAAEDALHPFGRDSIASHEPKRPHLRHLEEDPFGREVMTPPVRKRTQLRHLSSVGGASRENQVSEEQAWERYDPFMGIKRELRFDSELSLSLPKPTMSPFLSFSMAQTIQPSSEVTSPATLPGCVNVELTIESDNVDDVSIKFSKMPEEGNSSGLQEELVFTTKNKFSAPLSNEETNVVAFCLPKGKYLLEILQGDVSFSFKTEGEEVVWGGYYGTTVYPEYEIFLGYYPPMDETDWEWLDGINQRRKTFHEDNGVSYRGVVWSPHLKELSGGRAQDIVDSNCTIPQDSSPEGQTIYALITVAEKEVKPAVALEWQFEEQLGLNPNPNLYSGGQAYMRQMVWRSSRYVGCETKEGYFLNKDGAERHCHASVCYYARAGNCDITEENWLNQTLADRTRCGPSCGGGQIGTGEEKGVTGCY